MAQPYGEGGMGVLYGLQPLTALGYSSFLTHLEHHKSYKLILTNFTAFNTILPLNLLCKLSTLRLPFIQIFLNKGLPDGLHTKGQAGPHTSQPSALALVLHRAVY